MEVECRGQSRVTVLVGPASSALTWLLLAVSAQGGRAVSSDPPWRHCVLRVRISALELGAYSILSTASPPSLHWSALLELLYSRQSQGTTAWHREVYVWSELVQCELGAGQGLGFLEQYGEAREQEFGRQDRRGARRGSMKGSAASGCVPRFPLSSPQRDRTRSHRPRPPVHLSISVHLCPP